MPVELVICGIPFGTPNEKKALEDVKSLGFTSVQIYTFWRDLEPAKRGQFAWTETDRQVRLIKEAGLKYVPFILMGPKYGAPDWWLKDPKHAGLKCLEHGKESPIESIWNMQFRSEISRVLETFAEHFLPWNVLESIQPGICGDYGEAIFPALGNWPGDYHTHRGFWCGGKDAVTSFQKYLQGKYGTAGKLNRSWRSSYKSFSEVRPFLRQHAPSRTAFFDMIAWYQKSMTDYSEFWMKECRRIFPEIPAYLCTGGADDEITSGALFAAQAKAAAKHAGGIRLTNEVNKFYDNFRLTAHTQAACSFYGAYIGLEPVGPMTKQGVRTRMFGSAAYGNRQLFHYFGNLFGKDSRPLPAAKSVRENVRFLKELKVEKGIALFWPVDQGIMNGAITGDARNALMHVRHDYPLSAVSDEMILDGALRDFKCLVMMGVTTTRAAVLRRISRWVRDEGGLLLAVDLCRDLELEPVKEFDELFGISGDSEDAWGHHSQDMKAPKEFKRLGKITSIHCEHGWLNLMDDTEKISCAKEKPGQSGTRILAASSIFRRRHKGGGQAIFYCGHVSFERDPEACFDDPGTMLALLDDVCAMSGVKPLGTRKGEIARARVGGKMLVLTDKHIRTKTHQ